MSFGGNELGWTAQGRNVRIPRGPLRFPQVRRYAFYGGTTV